MRYKVFDNSLVIAQFEEPKDLLLYLMEAVIYDLKVVDTKRNVTMTITNDIVALKEIICDKETDVKREEEFKAALRYGEIP